MARVYIVGNRNGNFEVFKDLATLKKYLIQHIEISPATLRDIIVNVVLLGLYVDLEHGTFYREMEVK